MVGTVIILLHGQFLLKIMYLTLYAEPCHVLMYHDRSAECDCGHVFIAILLFWRIIKMPRLRMARSDSYSSFFLPLDGWNIAALKEIGLQ